MSDADLPRWLAWLEKQHPSRIELGLDRVQVVADAMQIRTIDVPLITVAGTNGKGSTVAMLEAVYVAAGYRVGCYTSPHIHHFGERVRVDGKPVSDADIVVALEAVEAQRGAVSLTYFEHTTLAAVRHFRSVDCEIIVLEVGLGGRLDACNLWDCDVGILTSVGLDHADWLGSDRSVIATEKAAIGRSGRPLIVGEPELPSSVESFATERQIELVPVAPLERQLWPRLGLIGEHQRRNAACVVEAVSRLSDRMPVPRDTLASALAAVTLDGRFSIHREAGVPVIRDVAHNPQAAESLAASYREVFGSTPAQVVFGVLVDKDLDAIVEALKGIAGHWHIGPLDESRARSPQSVADGLRAAVAHDDISLHASLAVAYACARQRAKSLEQTVLACGSFHVLEALPKPP